MFASAAKVITKALRGAGQSLDKFGRNLEVNPYVETVLPSTRVIGFKKSKPMLENVAFIAPSATVMGNVAIGQGSSVWYGAVVRGRWHRHY
jgi:acetyltransferase-like isoleucine patch superfamily enzyme